MNFDDLAGRLPPDKIRRLGEIKRAFPGTPLEKLPADVMKEVFLIFHSASKEPPRNAAQSAKPTFRATDSARLHSVIGEDLKDGQDVVISQRYRLQGLYIKGTTGTGKSTLLANLILTDIAQGMGVCLIEPHGDLTKTVLSCIPKNRLDDVILLDLMDSEYPFGLNIFECRDPTDIDEVAKTSSFVYHVFEKTWGIGKNTPRLSQVIRNVTQTLIENPGTTFSEIPFLFWNDKARNQMVGHLKNQQARLFWERYKERSRREREEYVESTDNKVDAYLGNDKIRHIVSQSKTTVDFRRVMDEGKILLILLSPQLEELSRLVGSVIIGKLLMAAFSRIDTDEDKRGQFNLYCDEYQRFATSDFSSFIEEARKFKVAITLSHQSLSQLDDQNRTAATGAANMMVFRVSGEDGKELAKNFDTTPTQVVTGEEPIRTPVSDVIGHLVKRGHSDTRVTRFAQVYLQKLENFIDKTKEYESYPPPPRGGPSYSDFSATYLSQYHISTGREKLNECLYKCMTEKTSDFRIPPLPLYILAVAQGDASQDAFFPFIKRDLIPPPYLKEFKETAAVFGNPYFTSDDCKAKFLNASRDKETKRAVGLIINMITELRYTMEVLVDHPTMVDTGQYRPKYQIRQHADMENEIATRLTQQTNYQAKCKLTSGEYEIRTNAVQRGNSPSSLSGIINQIKVEMRRNKQRNHYLEVEQAIRERQEKWTDEGGGKRHPGGPPPSFV